MKKNNEERSYTTLDAYRAGFLKLKGHEPTLIDQGGKIVFAFPSSDSLKKDIAEYESGAMVDAFKFSLAIKSLNTEIHIMRESREGVPEQKLNPICYLDDGNIPTVRGGRYVLNEKKKT